jgi:hypothetical protein
MPKHHTTNNGGVGGLPKHPNPCIWWWWAISFSPRHFTHRERDQDIHCTGGLARPGLEGEDWQR